MKRTSKCMAKLDRMNKSLRHQEADRVPIGDWFWEDFLKRWREDLGLPVNAQPHEYYDLDWIDAMPNMDPHIKPFEVLKETDEEIVVRTGYEAVVQKIFRFPMPAFLEFETDSLEKMAAFQFLRIL